ncbi:MAG TPA: MliC family protein [Thiobacillus sp.]
MKIHFPLISVAILLVSACASLPRVNGGDQTSVAAASTVHHYGCDSGKTIAATYPSTDSATINYKGSLYNMQIAVSASGARYIGGGLEWWTKGSGARSDGTLFRHMADGTSGEILELCTAS